MDNERSSLANTTQLARSTSELVEITIVGHRLSLESAQSIKRNKAEIVDSVVAEEIGKLPDVNVSEALQRVTGVQILRDRGEGSGITIRGLTQMETMLNGREVFTAGFGRNLDFTNIPAELVAGIDVYKTSSADQIEGGIGGTIDLRTRRPFDFEGDELSGAVSATYGDLVDRAAGQYSMLSNQRWSGTGGEFGLLLNLAYQERAWREDQKATGNPMARDDIMTGQTVFVPNGASETTSTGERERKAVSAIFQWRPDPKLELYTELAYQEFRTYQDTYQFNIYPSDNFVAGSPVLFPGTDNLESITWMDAPVNVLSFARDTLDRNRQLALGGIWQEEHFTLNADLSYAYSYHDLYFSGLTLNTTADRFSHDLGASIPSTAVGGTDLTDADNYTFGGVLYRTWPFEGDHRAARLDLDYEVGNGWIESLEAGIRLARRTATDKPGLIFGDAPVDGVEASTMPDYITENPYDDFFPGSTSVGSYLAGDISAVRDADALRSAFGVNDPLPTSNPLATWEVEELTQAAYIKANLLLSDPVVDGNLGVRVVRTKSYLSGYQSAPDSGAGDPLGEDNSYLDYLPSINLRYQPSYAVNLRLSLSQSLTRPDFNQLSPSLTLISNPVDSTQNQGFAGNPDLEPIRSDNLDVALERYYNPSTSFYLTGFYKQVDGFVSTVSSPEFHRGEIYQVSRPQNSNTATIRGLEFGYQQFYQQLPGWLSGFGLQANYTYVDSETISNLLGEEVPLQNLSKNSYNIVGIYDKDSVSARIAYNWRSRFLSSIVDVVGVGALPVYTEGYGWLDASLRYRLNKQLSVSIDATNLLGTVRKSYYGTDTRPQSAWLNDRQISMTLSVKLP